MISDEAVFWVLLYLKVAGLSLLTFSIHDIMRYRRNPKEMTPFVQAVMALVWPISWVAIVRDGLTGYDYYERREKKV